MAEKVDGIEVEVSLDSSKFDKGLEKADKNVKKSVKQMSSEFDKLSKDMGKVGTGLTLGLTTPIVAFGKNAIDSANALEVVGKRTKIIYGDMTEEVQAWSLEHERAFGLGAGTIEGYVGNIGDLVQGLGMGKRESLEFSQGATEVGVALSQWAGVETETAINDLTSALSGSHEVMSKYGVKLNETVLNEYTREAGLGESFNKLTEVQKAQVRYNAILGSSQNAIDNWNEGNRTAGFHTQELKEQLGNISETIGGQLKDSFNGVIEQIVDVVANVATMLAQNPELVQTIIQIAGVLAGLGPVLLATAGVMKIVSLVTAIMAGGIGALMTPVVLVIAGVTALYLAFATNFGGIRDTTLEIMGYVKEIITIAWDYIKNNFGESLSAIWNLVKTIWESIELYINTVMTTIKDIIKAVMQILQGDWSGAWDTIKNMLSNVWNNMKQIVLNLFNAIVDVVLSVGVNLLNAAHDVWNNVWNKVKEIWGKLCDWFSGAVEDPVGTILGIGSSLYNAGADMIQSVWNGCKSIWNNVVNWFTEKVNWIKDKLTFWKSSSNEMSGGGGKSGKTLPSRFIGNYALAGATSTTTNITFSGNYQFNNRSDIDYFMKKAGMEMKKKR